MDFIKFMVFNYDGTIDWFGAVVIAMLAVVAVALMIITIEALQSGAAVGRFFNKYETDTGIVDCYGYNEEHTSTVLMSSTIGKMVVNTPRTMHQGAEYFINLRCKNRGVRFIETYIIRNLRMNNEVLRKAINELVLDDESKRLDSVRHHNNDYLGRPIYEIVCSKIDWGSRCVTWIYDG